MLFNSIDFCLFLPIVFAIYWIIGSGRIPLQNLFLLVASYVFYGWWDPRFLVLIFISSLTDYIIGLKLRKTVEPTYRKLWLWLSVLVNIGMLAYFKYYNFFLESFAEAFLFMGHPIHVQRLNIILPVGISFYTFQTLSYTIDIYKKRMEPTRDMISFFAYVSFFPQLVAGPIERARKLLPQFHNRRVFSYDLAVDGMRQILYGFFKKLVIADNLAGYVYYIFQHCDELHSPMLFLGAFLFTAQLYCDFSAYSDIAIGTAKLFGFRLSVNFKYPAFSQNIPDFWRRWHITMTHWFRDYLFLALFGKKRNEYIKMRNTIILFLAIGIWHGPKWTYVFYGLVNGILFIMTNYYLKYLKKKGIHAATKTSYRYKINWISTLSLCSVVSVFFYADDLTHSFHYLYRLLAPKHFFIWDVIPSQDISFRFIFLIYMGFLWYEWHQEGYEHGLMMKQGIFRKPAIRWTTYGLLLFMIFQYRGIQQEFIYFQF